MEAIAGVRIRTGQAFVEQHGQRQFIGELDSEIQRLIRVRPPVHLAPVENVLSAVPDTGHVQLARAFVHPY